MWILHILFLHSLADVHRIVPTLGYYEESCSERPRASLGVSMYFCFSWVEC